MASRNYTPAFRLLSLLGAVVVATLPIQAQAPRPLTPDSVGLLVVAHGADSAWNARVNQVVSAVKWNGPVETVYLMGNTAEEQSWDRALARLVTRGATRAIAVPLMVSTHGSHVRQIEYYAGELPALPAELASMDHAHHEPGSNPIPVSVTGALDGAPELGVVLRDRFAALTPTQRAAPLVFVAHGPNAEADVARWVTGIHHALEPLIAVHDGAPIRIGLMRDDAPPQVRAAAINALRDTITTLAQRSGDSVTVMTVLVSSGLIDRVRVPNDLKGLPMRYVGSVLAPHPALSLWIARVATEERAAMERAPVSARVDRQGKADKQSGHAEHQ